MHLKDITGRRQRTVLIVDDEEVVQDLLSTELADRGFQAYTASSAEEGLTFLENTPIDVALVDIIMPGMNGIEMLAEIKNTNQAGDVIIMTSHASLATAMEALRLGAYDYLLKPFENLDVVERVVSKAIEKRILLEENTRLYQDLLIKSKTLEQSVKRLTLLNEISSALHSVHDLRELLQLLVQSIAEELGAERASLMLIDERQKELSIIASVGIEPEVARNVKVRLGEGIAGWVAEHGELVFAANIQEDPRFSYHPDRSYVSDSFISAPLVLSVPIKMQHEVIGVININNKKGGGSFTADDTQLVTTLAGQSAVAITNAVTLEKLLDANRELKETNFQTVTVLAEALEAKDAVTGNHSERMIRYAEAVALRLGLGERETELLRYAAVLHDIGKIGICEHILNKPLPLTPQEYAHVKEHPRIGAELVRKVKFLAPVAPFILAHHENYGGHGYPFGISGEEIPIQSRIVSVLDAYDAMTSERPYKKKRDHKQAIRELCRCSGSQFDPKVVEAITAFFEQENGNSS